MEELRKIDKTFIGRKRSSTSIKVEASQLRMFLTSTGEDGPISRDPEVARAAGFKDIPIPATYLFCLHLLSAKEPYDSIGILVSKWGDCCTASRALLITGRCASVTYFPSKRRYSTSSTRKEVR